MIHLVIKIFKKYLNKIFKKKLDNLNQEISPKRSYDKNISIIKKVKKIIK
jgi:hypothetical protein